MRTQVQLVLLLFFAFTFLVYVFPFVLVEAAKVESGATIIAKNLPQLAACVDNNGDGVDDNNGAACGSMAGQPEETTCGLQILSGVPINYGQLNAGQDSDPQNVTIKNVGTSPTLAKVKIKGDNWVSDAAGNPIISGPEATHVSVLPNIKYSQKIPLTSDGVQFFSLPGGYSQPFYFQFKVPSSGVNGSVHQDVTIDLLC